MTQSWNKIEERMNLREESKIDIMIAKAFWKAGWRVYPESGHRFQIPRHYDDSHHIDGISKDEANVLWIEFLKALNDDKSSSHNLEKNEPQTQDVTKVVHDSFGLNDICDNCGQMRKSHYGDLECQPDGKTKFQLPEQDAPSDEQEIKKEIDKNYD